MKDWNGEHEIFERLVFGISSKMTKIYAPHKSEKWLLKCLLKDKWQFASDKGDGHLTPDIFSDKYSLMIDVMRVNDQERKKGKNTSYAKAAKIKPEIQKFEKEIGIDVPTVILADDMSLPTDEHHNYERLVRNSRRVITKHLSKIPQYKHNHPGFKTVFLICNEANAYVDAVQSAKDSIQGHIVFPWKDKRLMENFVDSDLNWIIWYSPYTYVKVNDPKSFDKNELLSSNVGIINTSNIQLDSLLTPNIKNMKSTES